MNWELNKISHCWQNLISCKRSKLSVVKNHGLKPPPCKWMVFHYFWKWWITKITNKFGQWRESTSTKLKWGNWLRKLRGFGQQPSWKIASTSQMRMLLFFPQSLSVCKEKQWWLRSTCFLSNPASHLKTPGHVLLYYRFYWVPAGFL